MRFRSSQKRSSGRYMRRRGTSQAEAIADAEAALLEADAGRDDMHRLDAENWLLLLNVTVDARAAERWSARTEATMRRLGENEGRKVEWLSGRGWLRYQRGEFDAAVKDLSEAMAIEQHLELNPLQSAEAAEALAQAEAARGRYDEATHLVEDADHQLTRSFGEDHPVRIRILVARSNVAGQANDGRHELEYADAALALAARVDPQASAVVVAQGAACDAHLRLREYASALEACARAAEGTRQA